jgi:hypothetical protein
MKSTHIATLILLCMPTQIFSSPVEHALYSLGENSKFMVTLNGFPVMDKLANPLTGSTSAVVSHYVIKGENSVEIRFLDDEMVEGPEPAILDPSSFRLRLEAFAEQKRSLVIQLDRDLHSFEEPAGLHRMQLMFTSPEGPEFEHRLDFRSRSAPGMTISADRSSYTFQQPDEGQGPGVIRFSLFVGDFPLETLPWLTPKSNLDPQGEAAIRQIVTNLRDNLANQNSAALVTAFQHKLARVATASGRTTASLEEDLLGFYNGKLFVSPGFTVAPLDEADLIFVEFGDLNLVRVNFADGRDPINADSAELKFSIPLFFSKIDNQWVIVE